MSATVVAAHPGFWLIQAGAATVDRFAIVAWHVAPKAHGWSDVFPITIRGVERPEDGTAILQPDGTVVDATFNDRSHSTVDDWLRADAQRGWCKLKKGEAAE
jgi:hypothetical protein